MRRPLLEVRNLRAELSADGHSNPVLRGVELTVAAGEVVGLVGESGSGKSMTARAIMRLLPAHVALSGLVMLDGVDILTLDRRALRRIRASEVAMIFQDPRASANPVVKCGAQIREVLTLARGLDTAHAQARAIELLAAVSIQDPQRVLDSYPFELSGGMLQRVMIALALAVEPNLLIADEATTSLDVTVQADILGILDDLRRERQIGMIFITHDLALASAVCDRILVMYAGEIVEQRNAEALFAAPAHPYTARLLASRPDVEKRQPRLAAIAGRPPAPGELPGGCAFHPRCPLAIGRCKTDPPQLTAMHPVGSVACHRAGEVHALLGGEQ
jgi:oligopeptide/dipeptide ABC transporter ATP-binding protein